MSRLRTGGWAGVQIMTHLGMSAVAMRDVLRFALACTHVNVRRARLTWAYQHVPRQTR